MTATAPLANGHASIAKILYACTAAIESDDTPRFLTAAQLLAQHINLASTTDELRAAVVIADVLVEKGRAQDILPIVQRLTESARGAFGTDSRLGQAAQRLLEENRALVDLSLRLREGAAPRTTKDHVGLADVVLRSAEGKPLSIDPRQFIHRLQARPEGKGLGAAV